ncbi:MAG: tRNA 2-thiouridine(34) synthase MnmA [Spirochaetes bacterium]|nr:tRNA 2-thiouridine(34) synthase MnmA [Spirochaetota bacterium]
MRIAVAMSGGVDSSLTAVLLKHQGLEVIGLTATFTFSDEKRDSYTQLDFCCSPEHIRDAKEVAHQFGFDHIVVDIKEDFSREIIEPFCYEYLRGRTPSPCLHCNEKIKFKTLISYAKDIGCEKLATGHYARLGVANGRHFIIAGIDEAKDQSYFLSMLKQDTLESVLFPLGNLRKEETRKLASEYGLKVAHKAESQEICFVHDGDYAGFIERRKNIFPQKGNIIDENGKVLGKHRGYYRYTIGQRKGLGISHAHPLYVIDIRPHTNEIVVGPRSSLTRKNLFATNINYMKSTRLEGHAFIKIRSTQRAIKGELREADGGVYVTFENPVDSITPGQAAVFYDESQAILAAAWIEKAF